MSETYRVPKRQVSAEITVAGQPPALLNLFLSGQAERHLGYERPSDLLNSQERFFAAKNGDGEVTILQRDSIIDVKVAADDEVEIEGVGEADLGSPAVIAAPVTITLEDGRVVCGTVHYVMPEGHTRLQDYLNVADRFLVVREGAKVHLINKGRIAGVQESGGAPGSKRPRPAGGRAGAGRRAPARHPATGDAGADPRADRRDRPPRAVRGGEPRGGAPVRLCLAGRGVLDRGDAQQRHAAAGGGARRERRRAGRPRQHEPPGAGRPGVGIEGGRHHGGAVPDDGRGPLLRSAPVLRQSAAAAKGRRHGPDRRRRYAVARAGG